MKLEEETCARPGPRCKYNAAKNYWRFLGVRPCTPSCPLYKGCRDRKRMSVGTPCLLERRELALFMGQLLSAYGLRGDPTGEALAEVVATQRLRIRRGNLYLASLEHGGWSSRDKEYVLNELRRLEAGFSQALAQLRSFRGAESRLDLTLIAPVADGQDHT